MMMMDAYLLCLITFLFIEYKAIEQLISFTCDR